MDVALQKLAELATRLAHDMPPETLRLVARIIAGSEDLAQVKGRIASNLSQPHYRQVASRFLDDIQGARPSLSPAEVAAAVVTAACSEQSRRAGQTVELVWTGPDASGLPFRRTKQAILEVLNSAQERITLVSYAVYRIPDIRDALVRAAARGVQICVIVETPDEQRGADEYSTLAALGDDVRRCASVYFWPRNKRPTFGQAPGILHVKCAIADDTHLLVSSANLTEQAFTKNMELGVLIRGGDGPRQVSGHFDALVSNGVLQEVRA